ncbi:28S ribosomal protein S6, mitochondrial isoform X2 [Heptranchias perlo]|uniref:28S ribosomal protein S6, mitochondrial isoform X2 n=1 Tax=Heptranchias perlo TaxID=212740 RepID=UPI00355A5BF5
MLNIEPHFAVSGELFVRLALAHRLSIGFCMKSSCQYSVVPSTGHLSSVWNCVRKSLIIWDNKVKRRQDHQFSQVSYREEKRVQNARERARTGGGPQQVVDLTEAEEEALQISRTLECLSIRDGETGTLQMSGPSTTAEGDSSEELPASEGALSHLTESSTSTDSHTSVGPSSQLVGLAPA